MVFKTKCVCVCKFLLQETESERTLVILVMSNHCQKLIHSCWRQLIFGMVQENGCSEFQQGLLIRPRFQCSPRLFGRLPCEYMTPDLGLLEPTDKPRQRFNVSDALKPFYHSDLPKLFLRFFLAVWDKLGFTIGSLYTESSTSAGWLVMAFCTDKPDDWLCVRHLVFTSVPPQESSKSVGRSMSLTLLWIPANWAAP